MPNSPYPTVLINGKRGDQNDDRSDEYVEAVARRRRDRTEHYDNVVRKRPDALAYRPRP